MRTCAGLRRPLARPCSPMPSYAASCRTRTTATVHGSPGSQPLPSGSSRCAMPSCSPRRRPQSRRKASSARTGRLPGCWHSAADMCCGHCAADIVPLILGSALGELDGRTVAQFSVHVLTAAGAACALLALIAAAAGQWAVMFAWLGLALIVDAADGPLARRLEVARTLPRWSGETLDLVVDFTTYV